MKGTYRCTLCSSFTSVYRSHCSSCGIPIPEDVRPPLIGESSDRGVFRITFTPVEREFDSEDEVRDEARHSCFGEDGEFEGYEIKKVRSTVTPETHPYICGACRNVVAEHAEGRCADCGKHNWERREGAGCCGG